ncbi:MAG: hypothetical protein K8L97_09810 [Anaerolineae bacterium]|nr:hypothetical protein [Anaerolineae bacterium]
MIIRVEFLYQNTNGVRIPAGDYSIDDPALCGLGRYLVETKQAVKLLVVEAPATIQPAAEPPADPLEDGATEKAAGGEKALSEMTKAELIALAAERGIEIGNPKHSTKDEIIALLVDDDDEGGDA